MCAPCEWARVCLLLVSVATSAFPSSSPPGPHPPVNNFTVPPALLFTSLDDASNVQGLLTARGSTLASVPGGLTSPCNDSITLYAGILANATFELYMLEAEDSTTSGFTVRRYLSEDLRSYATPTTVSILETTKFTTAAIAKDNSTNGGYLLIAFIPTTNNQSIAKTYRSADGLEWISTGGSYDVDPDCEHTGLLHDPTRGWLSFQRVLQPLSSPKPYPDGVGAVRRRVVTVLSSPDGKKWSSPTVKNPKTLLTPNSYDPTELELGGGSFGFIPFWYPVGGSRLAAVASNYIPNPNWIEAPAGAAGIPGSIPIDGVISRQEWWIATHGNKYNPTSADGWIRPYIQQTQLSGNAGVPGQAAAPSGFMITHAPLIVAQTVMPTPGWPSDGMFWLWQGKWQGLMNWRVGGLYAPANAVFTSDVFTVPDDYLWLDVDSRWGVRYPTSCSDSNNEACQSYIEVELLPPDGDQAFPGYNRSCSTIGRLHQSEQGYPLTWNPKPTQSLAGKAARARIYMRDTTVFAIGGGNSWKTFHSS